MTTTRLIAFAVCLFAFLAPARSQSTFIRTYRSPGGFFPSGDAAVQVSADRIMLGGQQYNINGLAYGVLFITDGEGRLIRTREYRSPANPLIGPNCAIGQLYRTPDGNVMAGSYFFDVFPYQGGATKIDPDGNPVWSTALRSESATQGFIHPLRSGDFTLIGNARLSPPNTTEHVYALQFDENGAFAVQINANRAFREGATLYRIAAAVEDNEGNLYLAGVLGSQGLQPIILRINASTGLVDWVKQYSMPGSSIIRAGTLLSDGTIAWAGAANTDDAWILRTGAGGEVLFSYLYNRPGENLLINGIAETDTGNLVVSIWNGIAAGLDTDGAVQWAYTYNPSNLVFGFSGLSKTPDDGLLFPGTSGPNPDDPQSFLLIKSDFTGSAEGCCRSDVSLLRSSRLPVVSSRVITNYDGNPVSVSASLQPGTVAGNSNNNLCPSRILALNDTTLCLGASLEVPFPAATPGTAFTWTVSPGVIQAPAGDPNATRFTFTEGGFQTLRLQAVGPDGCLAGEYRRHVLVEPKVFDLGLAPADSSLCPGDCTEILFAADTAGLNLTLSAPGAVPDPAFPGRLCYPQTGLYALQVSVTDPNGCKGSAETTLSVEERLSRTPNAFTPDGDGINDSFRPLIECQPDNFLFRVYNRWGQLVYESREYLDAWNGDSGEQPAPSDVYIWVLETDALLEAKRGSVTLLR